MERIAIEKIKQQVLEMCADNIGLTSIMANKLSITSKQMNEIMDEFVKLGLVTKEREKTDPMIKKSKDQFWYELTPLGKNELK